MATQDLADRPPLDPEPNPQLIHHRSTLVTGDQLWGLTIIETTNPPISTHRIDPEFGDGGHRMVRIDYQLRQRFRWLANLPRLLSCKLQGHGLGVAALDHRVDDPQEDLHPR